MITIEEIQRFNEENQILSYFPEIGEFSLDKYPKHVDFFKAGKIAKERLFMAANRCGKTLAGAIETVYHFTGKYPVNWQGAVFNPSPQKPLVGCVAGDTSKTVRDILQNKLLGAPGKIGTGLVPKNSISRLIPKSGVPDAFEMVEISHKNGSTNRLFFKSYDQKRHSFQGNEFDWVLLDEEPPIDIYTECLLRTMTTNGKIIMTFTPLMGLTDVVLEFCPAGQVVNGVCAHNPNRYVVNCTWDDVPHLDAETKKNLLMSIPPYMRDARSKGLPIFGTGLIYPMTDDDITVAPFEIPSTWGKMYAMDVGWHNTAVLWFAKNPQNNVVYIYDEYKRGECEPVIHAEAIKARGVMFGIVDPAAGGRSQKDGQKLIEIYNELNLNLKAAQNEVESGLIAAWQNLSFGKLKVFSHLTGFLGERRTYHKDEKGRIVKKNDHFMDCLRYAVNDKFATCDYNKANDYNSQNYTMPAQSYNSPIGGFINSGGWVNR